MGIGERRLTQGIGMRRARPSETKATRTLADTKTSPARRTL